VQWCAWAGPRNVVGAMVYTAMFQFAEWCRKGIQMCRFEQILLDLSALVGDGRWRRWTVLSNSLFVKICETVRSPTYSRSASLPLMRRTVARNPPWAWPYITSVEYCARCPRNNPDTSRRSERRLQRTWCNVLSAIICSTGTADR